MCCVGLNYRIALPSPTRHVHRPQTFSLDPGPAVGNGVGALVVRAQGFPGYPSEDLDVQVERITVRGGAVQLWPR